jgi:hypothetical protein
MKDHPDADYVELKTIGKTFKCAKYQDSWKDFPKGLPLNSRGAMLQIFQQHLYSKKVEQPDFDENKVYLCANHEGNDYLLDPGNDNDKPFFVAVFSTEELLLNLAHQHQSGQDIHVMMDASYRVSTERKCGYIPVKIGTLTQTGCTVAYALVTKEDGPAHNFVTDAVWTSMEAVVTRQKQSGGIYV